MHQISSVQIKRRSLVIGFFLLGIGILFAFWGWGAYLTDTQIEKDGMRAVAHITSKETLFAANGDNDYIVEYWFPLPSGERVKSIRGVNKALWNTLKKGESVVVYYSATNPNRNFPVRSGVTSLGLTLFVSIVAVVIGVFGAALVHGAFWSEESTNA